MKLKIFQVDAFTNKLFSGNPAAVCPLDNWLNDDVLQNIAMENNLSETAFFVKKGIEYEIRWFTPTTEVDLCGHATLAAAFVLFEYEGNTETEINFNSPKSGKLSVKRNGELLTLNFPTDVYKQIEMTDKIAAGFDIKPKLSFKGKTDYLLVFESEDEIRALTLNFDKISELGERGVIVTASGNSVDFVSRFFAPQSGINEDPVTGSAYTTLIPYWSEISGKKELTSIQLSKREGFLKCRYLGNRVEISGQCRLYLNGEINIE